MQVFQVGGCVRDMIFGVEPKDYDYVVVGSTPQQMLDLGYSQVGKDFPVFLHPHTKDEYALARTERKSGNGYKGFEVTASPDITLEQDLKRRDLTMNAIAYADGKFYDPYGGRQDINNRILRHVDSEAFAEDPLRVLRLARFCAKFPDFAVDPDTQKMCEDLVASGELNHLTAERVRDEMYKALAEKQPSRFFIFLAMIGALEVVFPEIHALIGKTQPFKYHPEGDAFAHTMLVLDQMTDSLNRIGTELKILYRFCALTHDLGKGTSPIETLPHHKGHEMRGYDIVGKLCQRLHMSNTIRQHAQLVARYHHHIHGFMGLRVGTVVSMFDNLAVNRNQHIIDVLTLTSKCDARGRGSFFADTPYPQAAKAKDVLRRLTAVRASDVCKNIEEMSVPQIKAAVFDAKAEVVRKFRGS